jgi:5-methylcytosine-specific restriction endonuclease McrA
MNDNQEKGVLRNTATILRDELEKRCETSGFQARFQLRPAIGYTDGWYVLLGKIKHPSARLELWLDRYPGDGPRRFYYGFRIQSARELQSLTKQVSPAYLPKLTFTQKSREKSEGKLVWQLKPKLPHQNFDTPIYEDYYPGHRFYGSYDSATTLSNTSIRRMVERGSDFFSAVVCSRTRTVESKVADEVYPKLEPRVRREHLVRDRDPNLAKACKQRDGYRCRVCGVTFEEVYGELGRGFAESHHLHPLGRASAIKKTRLEDLVTVCANCHRMLHLMRGREHDLDRLKQIMSSQRRY